MEVLRDICWLDVLQDFLLHLLVLTTKHVCELFLIGLSCVVCWSEGNLFFGGGGVEATA